MKHKRFLTSLFVACLLVFSLASCTGTPSSNTTPTPGTTSEQPVGGKTINYWAMWSETEVQAEVFKEAIARYEAATGNTVKVNWLGRDVRLTLKSAIDAGEPIDIIENSPDWLYPNFGTEYLLKLDNYLNKTYATTGGKTLGETIIPSYIDFAKTYKGDGSVYYLPQQPSIAGMFYNKAILRKVGVTAPPATWAEFLNVCQKIKDAGYDVATIDDAYRPALAGSYLTLLKGQAWCDQLNADATGGMWGDPAVLQMAQAIADLASKGYLSSTTAANVFPAGQQELAVGATAIYLCNGSWLPNEVAATAGPDFEWGVCGFPLLSGSADPNTNLQFISQGFAISSKSQHPDDAAELIAYFMDAKTQQGLVDRAACVPAVDGVNWPAMLEDVKVMLNSMTGTYTIWGNMSDTNVSAALTENLGKLMGGDLTPEAFVDAMKKGTKRD